MALKQCAKCGNTFWCEPDAKLCVICRVIDKHRQAIEREKAAANEERQAVPLPPSAPPIMESGNADLMADILHRSRRDRHADSARPLRHSRFPQMTTIMIQSNHSLNPLVRSRQHNRTLMTFAGSLRPIVRLIFAISLILGGINALAQGRLAARAKLQILNAGPNPIDVFWINPDGKRAPKGKVEPGKDRIIPTAIGHRFVIVDGSKETEVVSSVPVQAFRYDPNTNVAAGPNTHEERLIAGWKVQVNKKLIEQDAPAIEKALELLRGQLDEIVRVVPVKAVTELQKVTLWMNPEYPGGRPRAAFHPDARWLREHGRDPAMAKGVEFTNVRIFKAETRRMPAFTLHELAHAYHNSTLPMGFGNPEIKAAYEKAKASGNYDRVECKDSEGRSSMKRAYAMENPQEYFAENTEAFFSRNDFFPFTRADLKQHDPEMFKLLAKLWGVAVKP